MLSTIVCGVADEGGEERGVRLRFWERLGTIRALFTFVEPQGSFAVPLRDAMGNYN